MSHWLFIIIAALWLGAGAVVKRDKVRLTDDDLEIGEVNERITEQL